MITITQIKEIADQYITPDLLKKVGITSGILFVVIIAQLLIYAVVSVIDSIPIVNGLLEIVGLIAVVMYAKDHLVTAEQRQQTITNLKQSIQDVTD